MTKPALRDLMKILVDSRVAPGVHDEDGVRCLRFNSGTVQSAMRVSAPFDLDLSYTQTMMGFLLFNADPGDILLVGLGGGSLSKYCHRRFPRARITTLEINPDVIALRDEFLIPPDDERFRVVRTDAFDYLARGDVQADILLLDGYDAAGLPERLCSASFYSNCRQALSDQGVLVANLVGGEPKRAVYLDRLREIFAGRVWWSRVDNSDSLIVFAVKSENYYPQWSRLMAAALTLGARYRLDLARVANDLRRRPEPGD